MNPAAIAALLLFAGSTSTAPVMADDPLSFATSEASSARIQEARRKQAELANEAAVEDAAKAVKADAKLDLDIRLIGRTSGHIAGET